MGAHNERCPLGITDPGSDSVPRGTERGTRVPVLHVRSHCQGRELIDTGEVTCLG
jgi:hypothetical protein